MPDSRDSPTAFVGTGAVGPQGEECVSVGSGGGDAVPSPIGYRMLVGLAAATLVAIAVIIVALTLRHERPLTWKVPALTIAAITVLALGLAAALMRRFAGAAFTVLIAALTGCVLVAMVGTGLAHPTWAWLVFPVLLLGASPQRRWTTPFCLALTAMILLVVARFPTPVADTYVDLLRVATFGAILLGLGDLERRGVDAFWIETARTASLHRDQARAASASMSFVASVAQYVAGPLRRIEAAGEMLDATGAEPTRVHACRQIILAADELDAVVDDVLDQERLQAGLFVLERAPVDLADVVVRSAAAAGHAVTVVGDHRLVLADEDRLSYALTALMEAVPASPDPEGLHAFLEPELGGVRLRIPAAALHRSSDPRSSAGERLAEAVVEAHGGRLRTEPGLALWLPAADTAPDTPLPDVDTMLSAGDDQARWFVVFVLALVAVGLALGPAWPGNLALFLAAETVLLVAERPARPDLANRNIRTAARVVVIGAFGVLVASSGGLLSPLWAVSGLLVFGDRDQGRRTTLGLGVAGSIAVGIAIYATWPAGFPLLYGAAPVAVPLVTAAFVARVNDGIDAHRRSLEALSRDLESSRAATTIFLAVISHELRTPLTSVRGYAESLLLVRPWTDEDLRDFVAAIREETRTLGRLIAELGDTAMIQRNALAVDAAPMDLADAARDAVRRQRGRSPEVTIDITCQSGMPLALADSSRVGQLLANILDNAVKHAPGSPIDVAVHAGGGRVFAEVADHGPGTPSELRHRIFEPFRRTPDRRLPGVGLGLYVCKGIVDAHGPGAEIRCEETPGGGTTIKVALPQAGAAGAVDPTMAQPDT